MNLLRIFLVCIFALGLGACRKKTETVEKEVREAGYAMTVDGWFEAIRTNDVSVMKKMVKGGFETKTKGPGDLSGLHVAAETGSVEAAEYLLNRGFSLDVKDAEGRTALMHAVLTDRKDMVKWLLRQGANPKIKDNNDFMALMLAVTTGRDGAVEQLATYHREDLDSALLLASLVGQSDVIDTLTNYGASVYARMENGRTPLMLAAQNGHHEAVALLMDIGASRFATTESGDTAQSFAVAAGHDEIAAMIEKGFGGEALALESAEEVEKAMEEYLAEYQPGPGEAANEDLPASNEASKPFSVPETGPHGDDREIETEPGLSRANSGDNDGGSGSEAEASRKFSKSTGVTTLAGARVSNPIPQLAADTASGTTQPAAEKQEELPLVMRHYRQRELPVEVKKVSGDVASLRIAGAEPKEVDIRAGESIPDSRLVVVRVFSRTETGKLNQGQPIEVGVVEVEDKDSGLKREWIAGRSASSHDPVALVEDSATGRHYIAKPGQKFFTDDGREFVVSDVRPSQLVIAETATGEVRTLRLRGPKG